MTDSRPTITPQLREEFAQLHTSLCKAINDQKRLLIIHLLGEAPLSVGELADALEASHANVSQHLAILRDQGVVDTERDGSRVIYSLRHRRVLEAIAVMREVLADETQRRMALLD